MCVWFCPQIRPKFVILNETIIMLFALRIDTKPHSEHSIFLQFSTYRLFLIDIDMGDTWWIFWILNGNSRGVNALTLCTWCSQFLVNCYSILRGGVALAKTTRFNPSQPMAHLYFKSVYDLRVLYAFDCFRFSRQNQFTKVLKYSVIDKFLNFPRHLFLFWLKTVWKV